MMMHKLIDKGSWFAPKRYGYGTGWPVKWQGWALILSYLGTLAGIAQLANLPQASAKTIVFALFLASTAAFVLIARNRTDGGWRWRWGKDS